MARAREEMETHFSQTAQERIDGVLRVYSDDPFWIRRLDKLCAVDAGVKLDLIVYGGGRHYAIDASKYSLQLRKRTTYTEDQRAAMAARLAEGRKCTN